MRRDAESVSIILKGLTIGGLVTCAALVAVFVGNLVVVIERGVGFTLVVGGVCLAGGLCALVGGFLWLRRARGPTAGRKFLLALVLGGIVLGAGMLGNRWLQRRQYEQLTVGGVDRQYLLHLPAGYTSANQSYPLLLVLHGGAGNAHQFQDQTHFNALADAEGFIVAYPDGVGLFEMSFHVWNSGHIASPFGELADDVTFLANLVTHLITRYAVNTSRVYVTGHSNGAMMTYRMAAEHPELFAAVAPVSGTIGGKASPEAPPYQIPAPATPVSVVHVHGEQDRNVKYTGGYPESGFQEGVRWDLPVNESIAFWVAQNQCDPTPVTEPSSTGAITLDRYAGSPCGAEVVLVSLQHVNHFWENLDAEVAREQFHGTSLAGMIWHLLENYAA